MLVCGSNWRQQTGLDATSQVIQSGLCGLVVWALVGPSGNASGSRHIVVFNWDLVSTVNIDVSGVGLQIGDQYEVRDAQNC
jgi:hypothetical protein